MEKKSDDNSNLVKATLGKSKIYQAVLDESPYGFGYFKIVRKDDGRLEILKFLDINKSFLKLINMKKSTLLRKTMNEIFPGMAEMLAGWINTLTEQNTTLEFNYYYEPTKSWFHMKWFSPIKNYIAIIFLDISRDQKMLRDKNQLIETILANAPIGIWLNFYDDSSVFMNKYMEENFNLIETWSSICKLTDQESLSKDGPHHKEELVTFNDGTKHMIDTLKTKLYRDDGSVLGILGIGMDITKRKEAENEIRNHEIEIVGVSRDIESRKKYEKEVLYQNYHDQLTGLYNRRFYEEELARMNKFDNFPITLVMADVNGLKLTNDAFGHYLGDQLLKTFANILKKECRSGDIIARIGGDEFIILLPRTNSYQAENIVDRIQHSVSETKIDKIMLSVSFGWSSMYSREESFETIYKQAEDAMYRRKLLEGKRYKGDTIKLITQSLYEKCPKEQLHCERVGMLCRNIGIAMGMSSTEVNELGLIGLLHDIGKIGIDEKILNKPDRLTGDEWEAMKKHSEIGYHILCSVNEFSDIAEYVLDHHERVDGKGYPKGLKSYEIPLKSKILAVAETFEEITSNNQYHKALGHKAAVQELRRFVGKQFDEEIVKIFIEIVLKEAY